MGIRPMLSSMARSKTGPLLVAVQIAVTLAIVINALFIIVQRIETMNRATGIDVENVIVADVRGFGADFDVADSITNDIDLIQSLPGVVAATVSNHAPLSGSGSGTGLRATPDLTIDSVDTGRYQWSEQGLDALGVKLARGRNFYAEEINFNYPEADNGTPPVVLVTQALATELFPDEDALGKTVYWGDLSVSTIIGIIDHMHGSWVGWDKLDNVVIQPGKPAFTNNRYLIRTEAGRRDELIAQIERQLGELNRMRVVKNVRSLEELAANSYRRDNSMAVVLSVVITLLIGLTALVIVGLSSFNVTQRTKQIGTRRALGATRLDIIRQFIVENLLITAGGTILGVLLTIGVAFWMETAFALPRLDWRYLPIGIGVLWLLSTLAVVEPARRAASVPPAVATRSI